MKVISPITMTDGQLDSSNVTEDDHSEWDESTTYAAEDRVIVLSTHKIYESVQGSNLGNDPTTDDGTYWTEISATNRWKAFDGKIADQVEKSGTITYTIVPDSVVTGIAFFGLDAAELQVEVYSDAGKTTKIHDVTVNLVETSDIVDWYTYFTTDLDQFQDQALTVNFTAYSGYPIDITIGDGAGTPKVGEIAIGYVRNLGETLQGSSIGLNSFSTKEQDTFGNWTIVSRAKSDPAEFIFSFPASDAGRIKRVLNSLRDTAAVYFAHEDIAVTYGALTYGFYQDYRIPLSYAGRITMTLEVEGLT